MEFKEIHIILLICFQALYTGTMDNTINSVLPSIILKYQQKYLTNMTSNYTSSDYITTNNTFNSTISSIKKVDNYINNVMSLLTTIKCLARLVAGPIPGFLINKVGPMYTLLCGMFIQFIPIIILYFAHINIILHGIVRVFEGASIPIVTAATVNLAWINFYEKGYHSIIISFVFIFALVGIVVSPYIAGNINKNFGYIYVPVYMLCHISLCILLWVSVYVHLKRNSKKDTIMKVDDEKIDNNDDFNENKIIDNEVKCDDDNKNEKELFLIDEKNEINNDKIKNKNKRNLCQIFMFYRLMGDPHVFILCLNLFMFNFIMACLMCTLPLWIIETYHVNEAKAGSVWVYTGVVAVITNIICIFLFHKYPQQRYLASLIGLLLIGTGIIILPFYPIYWAVAFTIGIVFFGACIIYYTSIPLVLEVVNKKFSQTYTSHASALPSNSNALGYLFGGLVAGPLVNLMGFRAFFLTFGGLNIVLSFLNIFLKRYS